MGDGKNFVFSGFNIVRYTIFNGVVVIHWENEYHTGSVEGPDLETALKLLIESVTEQTMWRLDD